MVIQSPILFRIVLFVDKKFWRSDDIKNSYLILITGLEVRAFANAQVDWGKIPGQIIPKTQNWYLMPPCLTQNYKVRIKGKVEQSKERSSALPQLIGAVAIEKGAFRSPRRLRSPTLLIILKQLFRLQ